jgi:tRNA-specific 2-thiouridylase
VAGALNWIEAPRESEFTCEVQVRYRAQAIPCRVRLLADGRCEVLFEAAFPAVTPGQAAVFYRGETVLGGGWIQKAISREAVSDQLNTLTELIADR